MIKSLINLLGVFGLLILGIIYASLVWGIACWKFWYWFILPVFPALPQVGYFECVGLMMFITLFKNHTAQAIIKDELVQVSNNTAQVVNTIMPWLVLFMGWFVHAFIVK